MITRRALLAGAAALPATSALAQTGLTLRLDDAPSAGIRRDLLIQWGDRVAYDAPPFEPLSPNLAAAEAQVSVVTCLF